MIRPTIRRGARGTHVEHLQRLLCAAGHTISIDGDFGPATERAVERFQVCRGLYADGIVGAMTWAALQGATLDAATTDPPEPSERLALVRVPVADPPGGYSRVRLRADATAAAGLVMADLLALGAHPTSSGGTRSLKAKVSANRSATSLHYLAIAWDLWVGGAMGNPKRDPYVVTRDGDRLWRVWARAEHGRKERLLAVRAGAPEIYVTDHFVDLTEIMRRHGWERIRSRPQSWDDIAKNRGLHGGTEWWHFQWEDGLRTGTSFGDELLRVYSRSQLSGTPPWRFRDRVWNGSYFAAA